MPKPKKKARSPTYKTGDFVVVNKRKKGKHFVYDYVAMYLAQSPTSPNDHVVMFLEPHLGHSGTGYSNTPAVAKALGVKKVPTNQYYTVLENIRKLTPAEIKRWSGYLALSRAIALGTEKMQVDHKKDANFMCKRILGDIKD